MNEQAPLLTIMVALNCEAKPWVDHYHLKKIDSRPFALYQNNDVQVVITGIGSNSMAVAVGWIAAQGLRCRVWLNIGTAGHATRPLGDIFQVHGVARSTTDRAHYPPLTARWKGSTDALLSVDTPTKEYPGGAAVDMEASAFFEAAMHFSSAELVQSIKVVSDNVEHSYELLNAAKITELMRPHVTLVGDYATRLCELVSIPVSKPTFSQLMSLKSTFSQQQQLKNLLHKAAVLGLEDKVSAQTNTAQPIKTVLAILQSVVEEATPKIDLILNDSENG